MRLFLIHYNLFEFENLNNIIYKNKLKFKIFDFIKKYEFFLKHWVQWLTKALVPEIWDWKHAECAVDRRARPGRWLHSQRPFYHKIIKARVKILGITILNARIGAIREC